MSEWFTIDAVARPAALLLALPALFLLVRAWRRRPQAIEWPALPEARTAGARATDSARRFRYLLRAACLVALTVAIAGPLERRPAGAEPGEGLDIVLALDASGSMRALDAEVSGTWRTRFDLAREVVAHFALRRAAEGDRVALVVFGDSAFTQCPLTSDGTLLAAALERVEPGVAGEATALGDAVTLAVKRAVRGATGSEGSDADVGEGAGADIGEGADADVDARPGSPGEGRVVVLLTDGRSNAGSVPSDVAIAIARNQGVRVHTVGIGSEGEVPVDSDAGAAGRGLRFERHDLDSDTLEQIASQTGGSYFEARSSADLFAVYGAIDALERTPRETLRPPHEKSRDETWLALAGIFLVIEIGAARAAGRVLS